MKKLLNQILCINTMKVSRDTPLAEITLRRYEKPYDLKGRELVKKLCLSIGLLQPGDSRDIIVDVLRVLLESKRKREMLNSAEVTKRVIALRKKHKLPLIGIAGPNIRRQLRRLRDLMIIERIKNDYRITEFEDLDVIYNKKIEKFLLESVRERVKEYFEAVK